MDENQLYSAILIIYSILCDRCKYKENIPTRKLTHLEAARAIYYKGWRMVEVQNTNTYVPWCTSCVSTGMERK